MSRHGVNRRRSAGIAERNPDPPVLISRTKKSSSASKILDFFKAPPSLEEAIADLEQANNYAIKAAELQKRGIEKVHKWAEDRGNTAISDVSGKMSELFQLLCTQQLILSQHLANNLHDMKKMSGAELSNGELIELEEQVSHLEVLDKKIEKELVKMKPSTSTFGNGQSVHSKLNERLQLAKDKSKAEDMIHQLRNDNEISKMFVFRRSVKGYSDAYMDYAQKVGIIFGATRELAELVPAIATEDVHHLRYEGGEVSQRKVQQVRRSLEQPICEEQPTSRLLSKSKRMVPVSPLQMGSSYKHVSPPPPYSPGIRYHHT